MSERQERLEEGGGFRRISNCLEIGEISVDENAPISTPTEHSPTSATTGLPSPASEASSSIGNALGNAGCVIKNPRTLHQHLINAAAVPTDNPVPAPSLTQRLSWMLSIEIEDWQPGRISTSEKRDWVENLARQTAEAARPNVNPAALSPAISKLLINRPSPNMGKAETKVLIASIAEDLVSSGLSLTAVERGFDRARRDVSGPFLPERKLLIDWCKFEKKRLGRTYIRLAKMVERFDWEHRGS